MVGNVKLSLLDSFCIVRQIRKAIFMLSSACYLTKIAIAGLILRVWRTTGVVYMRSRKGGVVSIS